MLVLIVVLIVDAWDDPDRRVAVTLPTLGAAGKPCFKLTSRCGIYEKVADAHDLPVRECALCPAALSVGLLFALSFRVEQ